MGIQDMSRDELVEYKKAMREVMDDIDRRIDHIDEQNGWLAFYGDE